MMVPRKKTKGFTLIELLVVIAIIAILASILFPVFGKAREKARQAQCTSNLRQMAMAMQMFVQDNAGKLPGSTTTSTWAQNLMPDYVAQKMFYCPSDPEGATDGSKVSYGYNGWLVRPDGTGLADSAVKSPAEVGAVADSAPAKTWPAAGLIGGGGNLASSYTVALSARHPSMQGIVVGFCDGHAKYYFGKLSDRDVTSDVLRGFFSAGALGLVDNPAGGVEYIPTIGGALGNPVIMLGGDYSTRPILMEAAEVYRKVTGGSAGGSTGADYFVKGFFGYSNTNGRRGPAVWGNGTNVAGGGTAIAKDAVVVIVNKNSTITNFFTQSPVTNPLATTTANLRTVFGTGASTGSAYQVYTYDSLSGTKAFFESASALGSAISTTACITVADDAEMVDKVAGDKGGIGYCSFAFADTNRVAIVGIDGVYFPTNSPVAANRWLFPTSSSSFTGGAYLRTLYANVTEAGATTSAASFVTAMFSTYSAQIYGSPLFRASYWAPNN